VCHGATGTQIPDEAGLDIVVAQDGANTAAGRTSLRLIAHWIHGICGLGVQDAVEGGLGVGGDLGVTTHGRQIERLTADLHVPHPQGLAPGDQLE
jgi:hypothetical protein